eukprot:2262058-Prorocentrum_lima.AAC.1
MPKRQDPYKVLRLRLKLWDSKASNRTLREEVLRLTAEAKALRKELHETTRILEGLLAADWVQPEKQTSKKGRPPKRRSSWAQSSGARSSTQPVKQQQEPTGQVGADQGGLQPV